MLHKIFKNHKRVAAVRSLLFMPARGYSASDQQKYQTALHDYHAKLGC